MRKHQERLCGKNGVQTAFVREHQERLCGKESQEAAPEDRKTRLCGKESRTKNGQKNLKQ